MREFPETCNETGEFRIGELAEKAGVTIRTVRYYEELGLLKSRDRKAAGHRRYGKRDLVALKRIKELKDYGLSLGDIIEIAKLARTDPTGNSSRLKLIARYREKLEEAEERKRKIESYIDELEWHIEQLENVENFQSCPGEECERCKFKGICSFAEGGLT